MEFGRAYVSALPDGEPGPCPVMVGVPEEAGHIVYVVSPFELPWLAGKCTQTWVADVGVRVDSEDANSEEDVEQ